LQGAGERIPLNDLRRSWIATSDDVRQTVLRVLAQGRYVHGPEHEAFENELAEFVGARHALGVASGTDALTLALAAVGCKEGSEVVTAANAGGYASIAAARLGCGLVYADVDPDTLLVSCETVATVIGPQTRAVVITHLYGNVVDVAPIVAYCRAKEIGVVEDCAQALGAAFAERHVGTFGDAAALSFYPTKNLGAAGDGGAVVTNHDHVADEVRSLRQYGWAGKYHIDQPGGVNSRLDELQASLLRIGLNGLDAMTRARRDIVGRYVAAMAAGEDRMVSGATPEFVAHLAVARFRDRERARTAFEAAEIATDIHYPVPDHRQAGLPSPLRVTDLTETNRAVDEVLTIPCFPEMREDEVDRVCSVLGELSGA
jgi:dTDP-4-amino-4,6-dideoxygalactose transaminase